MFAAVGISDGSTRMRTMVVITWSGGTGWNVEQPEAGDLALLVDVEQHVAAKSNGARSRGLPSLEMKVVLRRVGLGDEPRRHFQRRDVRLRRARRASRRARPRRSTAAQSAGSFRTSGQTATSTPLIRPAATSRMSHDPSAPSRPTDPDIPSPLRVRRQLRGKNLRVRIPLCTRPRRRFGRGPS